VNYPTEMMFALDKVDVKFEYSSCPRGFKTKYLQLVCVSTEEGYEVHSNLTDFKDTISEPSILKTREDFIEFASRLKDVEDALYLFLSRSNEG